MGEIVCEKRNIETALQTLGEYVSPTVGVSMLPMLKEGRDTVVIKPKTERLKPLDVALYKRGNEFVLHRVLETTANGYVIRGDNCYENEIVEEDRVIGVLSAFYRKDEQIPVTDKKYLRYAEKRVKTYKKRFRRLKMVQKIKSWFKKFKTTKQGK